jgi:hypothetical protein
MSSEKRFFIKSADGRTLTVYDDKVTLSQTGFMGFLSRGLSGEKDIYYCDMTSIQFKEAGWTAGYMEFTFPGSGDHTGGPLGGVQNENRFTFGMPTIGAARELNEEVLEAKKYIEKRISEIKGGAVHKTGIGSTADELIKLKNLLDSGVINQAEFDSMKAKVING